MTSSSSTTVGVLEPDIVTLIPYSAARRLRAIAVAATPQEVTVLIPEAAGAEAASELRSLTGLRVATIETPAERIDILLDRLAGSLESDDLWLQRRHIQALSRLVDHSVNMGQVDQVRSLVDRALEFAPYSAELWLMKARVSSQRTEVIRALTVASDIAPNDRRVLRWIQSLQDLEPDEPEASREQLFTGTALVRTATNTEREESPENPDLAGEPMPIQREAATAERPSVRNEGQSPEAKSTKVQPDVSQARDTSADIDVSTPVAVAAEQASTPDDAASARAVTRTDSAETGQPVGDPLLQSALELTRIRDMGELLQRTGEFVGKLAAADSATVFFRTDKSWVGWTNDEHLEAHLTRAVPRQDRLAAQVIKQGLPLAISDTSSRVEDVGQLICEAGVRSFALLPIRTGDEVGGLIYLNYRSVNRADMIFAPNLGRRIQVVLTCAGAAATAIRQRDEAPHQPAAFDALTGAYSPQQFERLLVTEIDRARRYRYSVALLSMDVDDFMQINTSHGREAGDQVLQELCSRVLSLGRSSDVLARQADDEFLLMLPQTTSKGAEILARRIHGTLEDPVLVTEVSVTVSLSIGLASFPERADDANGLIRAAEIALYAAKAQGKHRTHVADTLTLGN